MSTFRRSLMARILGSNEPNYVEGHVVEPYSSTIRMRYYYTLSQYKDVYIPIEQGGYFKYVFDDVVVSLQNMFDTSQSRNKLKDIKLGISTPFTGSMANALRRQSYLESIDVKCFQDDNDEVSSLSIAFGINGTDKNSGYFSSLKSIHLPNFNTWGSALVNCNVLTDIISCGKITTSATFVNSPLNLDSAKVVINALQDLGSDSATITLSTETWNFIENEESQETMDMIYEKSELGWNFA